MFDNAYVLGICQINSRINRTRPVHHCSALFENNLVGIMHDQLVFRPVSVGEGTFHAALLLLLTVIRRQLFYFRNDSSSDRALTGKKAILEQIVEINGTDSNYRDIMLYHYLIFD